jgi:hypothetical protein
MKQSYTLDRLLSHHLLLSGKYQTLLHYPSVFPTSSALPGWIPGTAALKQVLQEQGQD